MMNEFIEAIKHEQKRISKLIDLTEANWVPNDQGILILEKRKDKTYCYEKNEKKTYLGTLQSEASKEFVRMRFLKEKHRRLVEDGALLDDVLQKYQEYSFEAVMDALPDSYRQVAFEDFANERYEELKRWANADYPVNTTPFPKREIYAHDGRRVRSKGECIHANIFLDRGIPFRYDSLITLEDEYGNQREFSPDFVIQCLNRRMVFIEHLGMLADKRYAYSFAEKCSWYAQAGFILGVNFFVTSDDADGGTDSRAIMEVAKIVEKLFYGL